jgi:hypothetical protein
MGETHERLDSSKPGRFPGVHRSIISQEKTSLIRRNKRYKILSAQKGRLEFGEGLLHPVKALLKDGLAGGEDDSDIPFSTGSMG